MRPLAFLLAAALPLAAQAPQPRPHGPGAMEAIRDKHQAALEAGREASRAQAKAFHAAMENPKADEAQLRQAYDQMNGQRFQAMLEARAMRQEMRAVLTPDQQAKADAMRAQFKDRMKARMEQRREDWKDRPQPQNN
jgi:Spy/CpxP family protein refolding chaperone